MSESAELIGIKKTGRNEYGITIDRDTIRQEFFKAIGTDDENREKYGSLLLAHQNLITGETLETVKTRTPEEIIPKVVEDMLMVKKQMHWLAV